ncbi:MAG TPA: TonB-dependent receptor [Bryobacteraceae bacterium]|nr:TonB-dependent receptor [Bryobacteraceae bacterium]
MGFWQCRILTGYIGFRSASKPRVVCLALLTVTIAYAQSANTADLIGTIRDVTGGALAQATIAVTNRDTGVARTTITQNSGFYRLPSLPAGHYSVRASRPGFTDAVNADVILQIGQVTTVDLNLSVASQTQSVSVSGAPPMVEPERTSVGGVVNRTDIDNLPINGRNFLNFSLTVGGVTAQQTSGQGSGLSFNGQRGRSNSIVIDGADNNGQLNGNVRLTISQEAVQEFQVVTNQFSPEFGTASGGLVNIVSRSGSNEHHGDGFLFVRNEALDGRNTFVTTPNKPPFRRQDYGATLGGPIVKNKTFFFASVEYFDINQTGTTTISNANVEAINSALAIRPVPGSNVHRISNGTFPVSELETLSSLKVDHSFSENDQIFLRYIYDQDNQGNSGGVGIGGLSDVSAGGGQRDRDQSLLANWTHIFSPTLISETRFQFAPRQLTQYDNDPVGPRIQISGVANWGRDVNFPVLLNETRYQVTHSTSWTARRHFWKFGADIQHVGADTSFPVDFGGVFTFASLTDFLAGKANTFTQGFGDPSIQLPDTLYGFFLQDTFRVSPRLTMVYGLRYEYDAQPQGIHRNAANPIEQGLQTGVNRDGKDFAPRLGFTYSLDSAGKTVLRTGYGIFYDRLFLLVARNALLARQTITLASAAATAQFVNGAFPQSNQLPAGVPLPKPSLNITDSHMDTPYSQQANFGLEHQFGKDWLAATTYIYVRGVRLLQSNNINLLPPTVLTSANAAALGVASPTPQQIGRPYYTGVINPAYNSIQMVSASGGSTYNGLELTLQKRFSHGLQVRANYTYSKAIDNASDFVQAQQPNDPYTPSAERSVSDEDQRHRFTLAGVWQLPYQSSGNRNPLLRALFANWKISTLMTFHSGIPYNIVVGSDVNGDGNSSTDRPLIGGVALGRNTLIGPDIGDVDLRFSREIPVRERFRVQLLAEAFNLLNHVNYTGINTTWGTGLTARSTLGQYTAAGDPRQLQFGLKVRF